MTTVLLYKASTCMNFRIFRFANLHVMQYPATCKYITGIDNVKGFGLNVVPKIFGDATKI